MPLETLNRLRRQLRRPAAKAQSAAAPTRRTSSPARAQRIGRDLASAGAAEIRQSELDRTDLELIQIVLERAGNDHVASGPAESRRHSRMHRYGRSFRCATTCKTKVKFRAMQNLMVRLDDPAVRSLAASLIAESALSTPDPARFPDSVDFRPAPWRERLEQILIVLDERERQARLKELKRSLDETDQHADPDTYRAIELEYLRLLTSGRTRKS